MGRISEKVGILVQLFGEANRKNAGLVEANAQLQQALADALANDRADEAAIEEQKAIAAQAIAAAEEASRNLQVVGDKLFTSEAQRQDILDDAEAAIAAIDALIAEPDESTIVTETSQA